MVKIAEGASIEAVTEEISQLKSAVKRIEIELDELSQDLHRLRPDYKDKLKDLDKEPTKEFSTTEELRKSL